MVENGQSLEQRKETSRYFEYLSRAVLETDSVDEALDATEIALGLNVPIPNAVPPSLDAYFSHDIENKAAQGILNRTMKASAALTAEARRALQDILKTASFLEMTGQLVRWLDRYRLQIAHLLGRTQFAALLAGAQEIAKGLPAIPLGANLPAIPPTLSPEQAVKLVDSLRARAVEEREVELTKHPRAVQEYVRRTLMAEGMVPPLPPTPWLPEPGDPEDLHFPVIAEGARLLLEKYLVTREAFDALDHAARQKAFTVAGVEAEATLGKIRDSLADALQKGTSRETWQQEVLAATDEGTFLSEAHLEVVYRAAIQSALSDGQMAVLQHPFIRSGFPYVAYHAIDDDRVRPEHLSLEKHGIGGSNIYRIDDPVFQTFRPNWDFNCFLPGTQVQGRFILGLKSWYAGEVVEITTRSGKRLTVTANHPILTVNGFAGANTLNESDDLLNYESGIEDGPDPDGWLAAGAFPSWADKPRLSSPDERKHHTPAVIEKVFGALSNFCSDARMPIGADNLHGDAKFCNGYVDVVGPLWELWLDLYPSLSKEHRDFPLTAMDVNQIAIARLRAFNETFQRNLTTSGSRMSLGESLDPSGWIGIKRGPLQPLCFGLAAEIDASRYQAARKCSSVDVSLDGQFIDGFSSDVAVDNLGKTVDLHENWSSAKSVGFSRSTQSNLGAREHAAQSSITDPNFPTQLRERFSSVVASDKIIQVRKYQWSGHVYDLQSEGGWIVANGIFCSNCRCGWTAMTVEQAAREGVEEAIKWLQTGVEPSPPARVPWPPFRPPASFQRALAGAPLSIQLALSLPIWDVDAQFGLVGDEWHGPKPPGEGWVVVRKGPRGGKIWKHLGGVAVASQRAQRPVKSARAPKGTGALASRLNAFAGHPMSEALKLWRTVPANLRAAVASRLAPDVKQGIRDAANKEVADQQARTARSGKPGYHETLEEAVAWGTEHGVRIVPGNSGTPVSKDQINLVNEQVAKIPEKALQATMKANSTLDVVGGHGITDHPNFAHLKGMAPRGWEKTGKTFDNIPGGGALKAGWPTIIAVRGLQTPYSHGSANLIIHEHGHTVDRCSLDAQGRILSEQSEWQAIHRAVKWSNTYENSYAEESFAESFAKMYHSAETRSLLPPEVQTYFQERFSA